MRISVLFLILAFSKAQAHGIRTAYLEITESRPGAAEVLLKQIVSDPGLKVQFPNGCTTSEASKNSLGNIHHFLVQCPPPLQGQVFKITGLGRLTNEIAVRYTNGKEIQSSSIITPKNPFYVIPESPSLFRTLYSYTRLGIEHIFSGTDHLLFILGLLLLVGKLSNLLWTATAFTVAHSITLSLTALNLIHLPSAGAEAAIALTLVLVALDISTKSKNSGSREGIRMAFIFGLVHGLGFAGALREVGLPQNGIAMSLLGFNLGVEIGQIIFLIIAFGVYQIAQRFRLQQRFIQLGGYAIGMSGTFWLIERTIHWF